MGASVAANKIKGVRAAVIHETFSARQGVEDDNLNVMCIGGRVLGNRIALELVEAFLKADFSGKERHLRRLDKIAAAERDA